MYLPATNVSNNEQTIHRNNNHSLNTNLNANLYAARMPIDSKTTIINL